MSRLNYKLYSIEILSRKSLFMNIEEKLTIRKSSLNKLVIESIDENFCNIFENFILTDTQPIAQASLKTLNDIPRGFGQCVIMSAYLCALLTDEHKLPAVIVAGDLSISGISAFQTDIRIQQPNQPDIILNDWQGHCWVELGGLICDVSICRTADLSPDISNLRAFIHSNFGQGKGLIAIPVQNAIEQGMIYNPKEVFSDDIVTAIIKSHFSK